eukprot:8666727-Pyramimonas_sp.AAC.1
MERAPAGAVKDVSAPEGPYQVLIYMLKKHDNSVLADLNILGAVRMYDTTDAWSSDNPDMEYGTVLDYTIYSNNRITSHTNEELVPSTALLNYDSSNSYSYYYDNLAADPHDSHILKLINVSSSVKSIYVAFYRPVFAFDIRFELYDGTGNLISSYEDRTKSAMGTSNGDPSTLSTMLAAAHSKWNIPDLRTAENMTIPKVLDITGAMHDASAVNYANVYLYGTDGVSAKHDALAKKVVPATQKSQVIDVVSATVAPEDVLPVNTSPYITKGTYQVLPNGDIIHASGDDRGDAYNSYSSAYRLFDGLTTSEHVWMSRYDNIFVSPQTLVYEFSRATVITSMTFTQNPSSYIVS